MSEDSDSEEVQSDFEVVRQESESDDAAEMWDVNNENEDELKSSQIKGKYHFHKSVAQ
jgi:hypothetical protein